MAVNAHAPPITTKSPVASKLAPPPVNGDPLILKPESSTFNRSHVPAASNSVLHKPAVPAMDPIMVF